MSLINDLQKVGLSDKEAKVYIAALELGQDTVQNIGKKASVNRATTYVILESLSKKGLVSQFDKDKKTFFTASNPDLLTGIFELQIKEVEERKKYLSTLLPTLKGIASDSTDKPVIRFYEGKEGIVNAHKEFLLDQKINEHEVRNCYPRDKVKNMFTEEEIASFNKTRHSNKIVSYSIVNNKSELPQDTPSTKRVKVSEKEFPFDCDLSIYGDSIRIASLSNKLSAVLIKDKAIAKTFKSLFDLAWQAAEEKKKSKK